MKRFFLITFLWTINLSTLHASASTIVNWSSVDGINRFENSFHKSDFYQLANFYQPQINPLYCSSATATMILNALNYGSIKSQKSREVNPPNSSNIIPYPLYTQDSFFNELTDKIKDKEIIHFKKHAKIIDEKEVYDPGVNLTDFANILRLYNLKVEKHHISQTNSKQIRAFRKLVQEILSDNTRFIVTNFHGKTIGLKTGGHISPIVAYEGSRNSVLILDVALHKNKWFWVSLEDLYKSMNTMDGDSYRGYLIISK